MGRGGGNKSRVMLGKKCCVEEYSLWMITWSTQWNVLPQARALLEASHVRRCNGFIVCTSNEIRPKKNDIGPCTWRGCEANPLLMQIFIIHNECEAGEADKTGRSMEAHWCDQFAVVTHFFAFLRLITANAWWYIYFRCGPFGFQWNIVAVDIETKTTSIGKIRPKSTARAHPRCMLSARYYGCGFFRCRLSQMFPYMHTLTQRYWWIPWFLVCLWQRSDTGPKFGEYLYSDDGDGRKSDVINDARSHRRTEDIRRQCQPNRGCMAILYIGQQNENFLATR